MPPGLVGVRTIGLMVRSPGALGTRLSAVPRWSHRDPVEGGNPYPAGDPRHGVWTRATAAARAALARHDDALAAIPAMQEAQVYGQRVVGLATMRFDTWARRGLATVCGDDAQRDYGAWLRTYVANWRAYVADTCPHVAPAVRKELHACLRDRATHWATRARRESVGRAPSDGGAARPD